MIRRVIVIDGEKCNGCGLCAKACHEGAIGIVDGKARLLREDHCDGLGDCLPSCPQKAIEFEMREAPAYNEQAVLATKRRQNVTDRQSCLVNFPVQMKLVPENAPYFNGAELLIAADCAAYAYGNFHRDFMMGKVTLIGCPKLDMVDYTEKLTQIFKNSDISGVTVARMTVPCCGGLPFAVKTALQNAGKDIPLKVVVLSPNGQITA